jgi:hypothetical protein
MSSYPYTHLGKTVKGNQIPPAPFVKVKLTSIEIGCNEAIDCSALLDTGSALSLFPRNLIVPHLCKAAVGEPEDAYGVGGGKVIAIPYIVNIRIGDEHYAKVKVWGYVGNQLKIKDEDEMAIIGRDFMRQLRIEFDGINSSANINPKLCTLKKCPLKNN